MLTDSRRTASGRRGFSVVELMVVIVLLGIVMGSLMGVISKQQRFYRGAREIMETRGSVRQGIEVLRAELRGASSVGGDLYPNQLNETSIELRSTTGSSVICSIPAIGGNGLVVPPAGQLGTTANPGGVLSMWRDEPQIGDSVLIYDAGPLGDVDDDSWTPLREITGVAPVVGACGGTPFVTADDAGKSGYALTVSPALTITIPVGTPIRVFRRVRYELFQASDARWYLGFSECQPSRSPVCSPLEAVSGPYRPLSQVGQSGVGFYYYDVNGAPTTNPALVAKIDVAVRGQSEQVTSPTAVQPYFRDSSRVSIGLRNRK
jgi:prepilin-type N-terminal cleavage/methylation domain-containing protein